MTPQRLRAGPLDRSVWGVRSPTRPTTILESCHAVMARMPEHAFVSHLSAALIHGIPLPFRLAAIFPVHVAVPAPQRAPHAAGIVGHRLSVEPTELRRRAGLAVTSPERTWCDLAEMLGLHDLVAAGDHLIHHRHPITTPDQLRDAVQRRRSIRGSRLLLRALELLDPAAESPPESVLRVILIEAGAPAIRVNHSVTDRFGEFVGRTDLISDEWRLVLEYQGDYHRTTPGQWRADMTRRSRIEAQGWRVMEVNADDLKNPAELMSRILARVAQPI